MGYFVKNRRLQSGSSGVVLPSGGTATRPDNPTFGLIRYNTDSGFVEYFNGTVFVSLAAGGAVGYTVDNFTGDGITTVFVMSIKVSDPTQIIVFVGSVYQIATTNYTVGGPANFNITFTSAPPNGLPINVIHTTS
jgi:hypothetical protein